MNAIITLTAAVVCALVLTACGGGGGDDSPVANATGGSTSTADSGPSTTGNTSENGTTGNTTTTGSTGTGSTSSDNGSAATGSNSNNDGGTTSATDTGSSGSDNPDNIDKNALTFNYQAEAPLPGTANYDDAMEMYNNEGAGSYRWIGSIQQTGVQWIYVKDNVPHVYDYLLVTQTPWSTGTSAFLDQLNQEGAEGYRYAGSLLGIADLQGYSQNYNIYVRDENSTANYTYAIDDPANNKETFLTQAEGYGKSGYYYLGIRNEILVDSVNLYEKESTSNAIYTYEATSVPDSSNVDLWLSQLNSQGAEGYRPSNILNFDTEKSLIYVKDQNQSATFTYQSVVVAKNNTDIIQQANIFGAEGYWYFTDLNASVIHSTLSPVFIKPINCTNYTFCTAQHLL